MINHYINYIKTYGNINEKLILKIWHNCQLHNINLLVSAYLIYKFTKNCIITIKNFNLIIVTSLILSNKSFDDQCYTLKTWQTILSNSGMDLPLSILNQLEQVFLSSINYDINYTKIQSDSLFLKCCDSELLSLILPQNNQYLPLSPISLFGDTDDNLGMLTPISLFKNSPVWLK